MDPVTARKMWRTMEPYHAVIYFTPRASEAYGRLGLPGHAQYFASRAAPMGAVSADVVTATFYNFYPDRVRAAIPAAWQETTPAAIVDARITAVDAALRELLEDAVDSKEMVRAAETARAAAQAATPEGRPLFAGHAGLDWPDEPHLVLWHAITLLREYRGDGHVAALVFSELDPCEALITYGATADAVFPKEVLKLSRGWPDDEWGAATARLTERGLLDDDAELTPEGLALRDQVEDLTDQMAMAPWEAIGQESCDQLRSTVRVWSRAIVDSGVLNALPQGLG